MSRQKDEIQRKKEANEKEESQTKTQAEIQNAAQYALLTWPHHSNVFGIHKYNHIIIPFTHTKKIMQMSVLILLFNDYKSVNYLLKIFLLVIVIT